MDLFFYGTLRDPRILAVVLGHTTEGIAASLEGFRAMRVAGGSFPTIERHEGAVATGLLLTGLNAAEVARLDFYEAGFGYRLEPVTVSTAEGDREALVYFADAGVMATEGAWTLEEWAATFGEVVAEAAPDYMALWPETPPGRAMALYPQILDRAASRVRARRRASTRGLRQGGQGGVRVIERKRPYTAFFALEDWRLTHPTFDGGQSAEVRRSAFMTGDAATVLPYDPVRDRVLLVEQFRFGACVRGDPLPWSIEPVAGRIDGGDTPEATVRREAMEEAGLALGELIEVARYYVAPGVSTEYLFSFIGLADLPDEAAGHGGLADEHEDIRTLLVSFDALMEMVTRKEAENGPLLISALMLARLREGLRR